MRAAVLAVLALALAGCASSPEQVAKAKAADAAELAQALDGRLPGKPSECIDAARADGPQVIGQTLLYRDGARIWRTEAVGECPSLYGDPVLIAEVYGGQLCRNDRFRTVERGGPSIPSGYCRFGDFTPYTKPRT